MRNKSYDLIVVAHPDDETLFFGGLLQHQRQRPWEVICVTDGNADGLGAKRKRQFVKACKTLGVQQCHWWGFPDKYKRRLDIDLLTDRLQALPRPRRIFTHNILGEYGHPHHQDVSMATHLAFFSSRTVYSTAYNAYPSMTVKMTPKEYRVKTDILSKIYGSETTRFSHLLPATWNEGFITTSLSEVESLYRFLSSGKKPRVQDIVIFKWYWPYLRNTQHGNIARPF